jgi:hypothetical protein
VTGATGIQGATGATGASGGGGGLTLKAVIELTYPSGSLADMASGTLTTYSDFSGIPIYGITGTLKAYGGANNVSIINCANGIPVYAEYLIYKASGFSATAPLTGPTYPIQCLVYPSATTTKVAYSTDNSGTLLIGTLGSSAGGLVAADATSAATAGVPLITIKLYY